MHEPEDMLIYTMLLLKLDQTGDSGLINKDELFLTGPCKQLISLGERYLSPFMIENQLQNIEGVKRGTLLTIKDQHILAIQSALKPAQLKQHVKDIPHDKIILVAKIPMDARHHSKIDYEKLNSLLTNQ